MAASLLDLDDLIEFQLERLKFDELNYKDELQLQRQLLDLDVLQCSQRRLKQTLTKSLANQQHQALQVPEASSCTDLPTSLDGCGNGTGKQESDSQNNNNHSSSSTGAIARTSSGRRPRGNGAAVGGSVQNINNGSMEIAMEELGAGAYGGVAGGGVGGGSEGGNGSMPRGNISLPSFSDSEEEAFNLDHQKEFR